MQVSYFLSICIALLSIIWSVHLIGEGSSFIYSLIFTLALICATIFQYKIIKNLKNSNNSNADDAHEESVESMILTLLNNKIENVNIFIKIKDFSFIVLLGLGVLTAGLLLLLSGL